MNYFLDLDSEECRRTFTLLRLGAEMHENVAVAYLAIMKAVNQEATFIHVCSFVDNGQCGYREKGTLYLKPPFERVVCHRGLQTFLSHHLRIAEGGEYLPYWAGRSRVRPFSYDTDWIAFYLGTPFGELLQLVEEGDESYFQYLNVLRIFEAQELGEV